MDFCEERSIQRWAELVSEDMKAVECLCRQARISRHEKHPHWLVIKDLMLSPSLHADVVELDDLTLTCGAWHLRVEGKQYDVKSGQPASIVLSRGSACAITSCNNGAMLGEQRLSFQLLDAHGNQVSCLQCQRDFLSILVLSSVVVQGFFAHLNWLCRLTTGITT